MEFDPFGDVQACCANALYPLGNVTRSSLLDIWSGQRAQALRTALSDGDLSLGCGVCRYRLTYGHGDLARDYYDNFPTRSGEPDWPYSLQFSLHNTCNLQCVMCGADRSSAIRGRRSNLPPLPHVYGDRFFDELRPFLENAGAVDFSGGEPFLVTEHHRIWNMLARLDRRSRPLCSLTTNGTVWNERVERVLDELDMHITVSVDGMTAATFEAIRVGARFEDVMTNIDRFVDYTRERGTLLTISWSLLQQNWFELGSAMRFAEERGIRVKVNTVIEPDHGVQRLPTHELQLVVDSMESESERLLAHLTLNRAMWQREIDRLRQELELRRERHDLHPLSMEPAHPSNSAHVTAMILDVGDRCITDSEVPTAIGLALMDLERWCGPGPRCQVVIERSGKICSIDGDLDEFRDLGSMVTPDLAAWIAGLEVAFGGALWIAEEFTEGDRLVQSLWVGRDVRDKVGVILRVVSIAATDRITVLVGVDRTLSQIVETPVVLPASEVEAQR